MQHYFILYDFVSENVLKIALHTLNRYINLMIIYVSLQDISAQDIGLKILTSNPTNRTLSSNYIASYFVKHYTSALNAGVSNSFIETNKVVLFFLAGVRIYHFLCALLRFLLGKIVKSRIVYPGFL